MFLSHITPLWILLIGFSLLVLGFVLPVLMIMQVLESTFLFNFVSYGASFLGLMLGFIGSVLYVSRSRRK